MQDRYAGDLGDFSKFGILRALAGTGGPRPLRIGLVWYLARPSAAELRREDGRHVAYLDPSAPRSRNFPDCDADLLGRLRDVVRAGDRSVAALERAGVLPPGTAYFSEPLDYAGLPRGREIRLAYRDGWLRRALAATAGAEIVCLDPDNGMARPSVPRHALQAPKYAYPEEVVPFAARGQDVLLYQHAHRRAPARAQAARAARELSLLLARPVGALLFRRGSVRTYLLAPSAGRRALLFGRLGALARGPWGAHVEPVPVREKA